MIFQKKPKVLSFGSCLSETIAKHINIFGTFIKRNRVDLFNSIHILKNQIDLNNDNLDLIYYSLKKSKRHHNFNMILNQTKQIPLKYTFNTNYQNKVSSFLNKIKKDKIDYLILDNYNEILFGLYYIKDINKKLFINKNWFSNDLGFEYTDRKDLSSLLIDYQIFIDWIRIYQKDIKIYFLNFPFDYAKSNVVKQRVKEWKESNSVNEFMKKNNINYINCPTPPKNGNDMYHFESQYYTSLFEKYIKNN